MDLLQVDADGTKFDAPIHGLYLVEPSGMLNLGASYGKVKVGGLSLEEATNAVVQQLRKTLTAPVATVTHNNRGASSKLPGNTWWGPTEPSPWGPMARCTCLDSRCRKPARASKNI